MQKIDKGVETALTGTAAANHDGIEVAPVFSAIQPHTDVLGEYLIGFRVFGPVLSVDGAGAAPLGRAVFLSSAVVASGR